MNSCRFWWKSIGWCNKFEGKCYWEMRTHCFWFTFCVWVCAWILSSAALSVSVYKFISLRIRSHNAARCVSACEWANLSHSLALQMLYTPGIYWIRKKGNRFHVRRDALLLLSGSSLFHPSALMARAERASECVCCPAWKYGAENMQVWALCET